MGIEDFKRWHWIAISVVIGAILTYLHLYAIDGNRLTPDETRPSSVERSEWEVIRELRTKTDKGVSLIYSMTIYPAVTVPAQGGVRTTQYVEGIYYKPSTTTPGKHAPETYHLITDVPYKPPGARTPPRDGYTFREYIDDLKKQNPEIHYSYAWWATPPAVAAIWGGGSILVIGGIWPLVVSLIVGAGFGRPKKAKDEYDLDRFGKSAAADDDQLGRPQPKVVSQEDQDKLRQLQETLERNLAASGVTETSPSDAPPAPPAEVRKLDGRPLEAVATAKNAEEEAKEFKGEFYPVARPVAHQDGEQEPTTKH